MLQQITPERLNAAAADPNFLKAYDEAIFGLDQARTVAHPWWRDKQSMLGDGSIAYFSAEFALHQSLPIYAGGLGVLAGDHCKEAADLGLPFVGIGFMYPQGYFRQRMTNDGWQEERYEKISWTDAPIEAAITPDGRPCITAVPLGDRTVLAAVWRVRLGRVRLFLLDTDLAENAPWDRELSARLYGGGTRNAHPAGNHPRHRRRARACARSAFSRRCGTSTRVTPPSSRCSASAKSSSRAARSTTRSKK